MGIGGKVEEFQKQNTLWKVDLAISVRSLPWAEGNKARPLCSGLSHPRLALPCSPSLLTPTPSALSPLHPAPPHPWDKLDLCMFDHVLANFIF